MTVTLTLARGLQAAYLDVPNPKQAGYLKAVEAATANTARAAARCLLCGYEADTPQEWEAHQQRRRRHGSCAAADLFESQQRRRLSPKPNPNPIPHPHLDPNHNLSHNSNPSPSPSPSPNQAPAKRMAGRRLGGC